MQFVSGSRVIAYSLFGTLVLLSFLSEARARQLNHRSENEWTSTQKASLGNIGALSENFIDQFFSDPSMQARQKGGFSLQILSLNTYFTDDVVKTKDDLQAFTNKLQSNKSPTSINLNFQKDR